MLGPATPRRLDQPIAVSPDDLVPPDHFYRHLETKLDVGFVRELARTGPRCSVMLTLCRSCGRQQEPRHLRIVVAGVMGELGIDVNDVDAARHHRILQG
jgi:hypothetical protein